MTVFLMVRTVSTTIYAVIREIQRCKHHNTVAIKLLLNFCGLCKDAFQCVFVFTGEQDSRLAMRQSFEFIGLVDEAVNQFQVVLIFFRIAEGIANFFIVNKFSRNG